MYLFYNLLYLYNIIQLLSVKKRLEVDEKDVMTQATLNNSILKSRMDTILIITWKKMPRCSAHKGSEGGFGKKMNARAPDVVIKTLGRRGINGRNNPAAGPAFRL